MSVWLVRRRHIGRPVGVHGELTSGHTKGEDDIHVGVVLDGLVEELSVLRVILERTIVKLVVIDMLDACEQSYTMKLTMRWPL